MSETLEGRVAIVGGNSESAIKSIIPSLIGQGVAIIYPAKSASAIQAIKEKLDQSQQELFTGILIDYPDYEHATELIELIIERWGKIDLAIVCLDTYCSGKPLTETSFIDWDKMIDLNITPFFIFAKLILQHMIQIKSGLFVSLRTVSNALVQSQSPLSRISQIMQTEMSNIFRNETKGENIECIHLVCSEPLKQSREGSPDFINPESNDIGSTVLDLFKRNITRAKENISITEFNK